ncbi:hypothetical protein [Halomicrococcus sp. SG-WS-1]|uniref:hypothetical protein n=1 Tax=Halomicrococcus sp. SG-WS-1 TaxID=3439057 RepID=UPI003F79EABE
MNDHLPDEKQYSIVHRDRMKPPGHPDEEIKMYEVVEDDLENVPLPPDHVGITVIAYDADGNMYELSEREGNREAQQGISSVMKDLAEE